MLAARCTSPTFCLEKPVIYSRIALFWLCVLAVNAHAVQLLTDNEEQSLQSLERQFSVDDMLISANNNLSLHNERKHAYADMQTEAEVKKAKYQELVAQLPKVILAKGDVAGTYKEIESLVVSVENLEQTVEQEKRAIKIEADAIQAEYSKIEQTRATKNERLLALKASITKRIVNELSGSRSAQTKTHDGSVSCSKFKSMDSCLKEAKSAIVAREVKNDPFLSDRSVLLSYDVVNASMDLSGRLQFRVEMAFKPSYNSEIDALLNEKLGLNSAYIKLVSNVAAEWFVDGAKVGEGKEVTKSVPLGRHSIMAVHGTQTESTVELIQGSGEYRYVFGSRNSVAKTSQRKKKSALVMKRLPKRTPPKPGAAQEAKSKPVAASKQTSKTKNASKVCFGSKTRCY